MVVSFHPLTESCVFEQYKWFKEGMDNVEHIGKAVIQKDTDAVKS